MLRNLVAVSALILATTGSQGDYIRPKRTNYDSTLMKDAAIADSIRSAQSLMYIPEPKGQDYQQLPAETELLHGGDCEDLATWLAHTLWEHGVNARIETGKSRLGDKDLHCWVELECQGETYVLDSGARLARKRADLPADRFVPFVLLRNEMTKSDFDRTEYRLIQLEQEFGERYFLFYGHYPGELMPAPANPICN
jgi:hypothetical protein